MYSNPNLLIHKLNVHTQKTNIFQVIKIVTQIHWIELNKNIMNIGHVLFVWPWHLQETAVTWLHGFFMPAEGPGLERVGTGAGFDNGLAVLVLDEIHSHITRAKRPDPFVQIPGYYHVQQYTCDIWNGWNGLTGCALHTFPSQPLPSRTDTNCPTL